MRPPMRAGSPHLCLLAIFALGTACRHGAPPPGWLLTEAVQGRSICSWGVAGRAYDPKSEGPKDLATERAVTNLAGMYVSHVIDTELSKATERSNFGGRRMVTVEVPEDIVELAASKAETETWRDADGTGPLGKEGRGFTYARACIDDLPVTTLSGKRKKALSYPPFTTDPPPWLDWVTSRDGAALCAVGMSDPFYDPAEIFQAVVDSVRAQLLVEAKTWVAEEVETRVDCRADRDACDARIRAELAITTEALSKGVAVTHFWYDRVGAHGKKRAAWGWGCVYKANAAQAAYDKMRQELLRR